MTIAWESFVYCDSEKLGYVCPLEDENAIDGLINMTKGEVRAVMALNEFKTIQWSGERLDLCADCYRRHKTPPKFKLEEN